MRQGCRCTGEPDCTSPVATWEGGVFCPPPLQAVFRPAAFDCHVSVVVVVVEVYLTSHHKQAISPPLIHVDDRRNEREGGDRSMERGRVEINKQSTSGLHQSKNGMGTQNSFIHILQNTFTILQSAIPQKHTSRKAFKVFNGAMMRF